jgi:hypothetical protein
MARDELIIQSYNNLCTLIILILLIIIAIFLWYYLKRQNKIINELEVLKYEIMKLKKKDQD